MPSTQRKIIKQAKFIYYLLEKAFEKQTKAIEDQGIKQIEALKALKLKQNQELKSIEGIFPKNMRTDEIKNEIDDIRKWEEKIEQKDLNYKTNEHLSDF